MCQFNSGREHQFMNTMTVGEFLTRDLTGTKWPEALEPYPSGWFLGPCTQRVREAVVSLVLIENTPEAIALLLELEKRVEAGEFRTSYDPSYIDGDRLDAEILRLIPKELQHEVLLTEEPKGTQQLNEIGENPKPRMYIEGAAGPQPNEKFEGRFS